MPKKVPNVDISSELQAASKALAPAVRRLTKALGSLDPTVLPSGSVSDLLYDLRQTTKQVAGLASGLDDALKPAIKVVEEHFIRSLAVDEASGLQGSHSRTQVTETAVPVIKPEDWPAFYTYVVKTKQWELLQHSVNAAAVRERWDAEKQVKYVSVFHAKRVSCTKLGGK